MVCYLDLVRHLELDRHLDLVRHQDLNCHRGLIRHLELDCHLDLVRHLGLNLHLDLMRHLDLTHHLIRHLGLIRDLGHFQPSSRVEKRSGGVVRNLESSRISQTIWDILEHFRRCIFECVSAEVHRSY